MAAAGTQSVDRALDILRTFQGADERTPTQVARMLGLRVSTAQRLMHSLLRHRLLEQDPTSRRYRLGLGTAVLGRVALERLQGSSTARMLEGLRDQTGEGLSFGVPGDGVAQVLLRVHSRQPLRIEPSNYDAAPRHVCVLGKALMAFGALEVDGLTEPFERFTERTLVDYAALRADLARTRERGYAVSDEEVTAGVSAIAVPVFAANGRPWAAVSVFAPTIRFGQAERERAATLTRGAIARTFGDAPANGGEKTHAARDAA